MKKISLLAMLLAVLAASGCSWLKYRGPGSEGYMKSSPSGQPSSVVTPDLSLAAKVVRVNPTARFVILNFPQGQMPKPQQTMYIYRSGVKVAQVTISESKQEQMDNNIVADIVTGDPQAGDTVRGD
jgi:hypothetical protein